MVKGIAIVTGIGTKEARRIFSQSQEDGLIHYEGKKYKLNAASTSAICLSDEGYYVYAIGTCQDCLERTSSQIKSQHTIKKLDLFREEDRKLLVNELTVLKEKLACDLHLIFYESVSKIKKQFPIQKTFTSLWEVSPEAISAAIEKSTGVLLSLIQSLRKIIEKQKKTKIIIISSLSAVTPAPRLGLHTIPKGAMHAFARTLALDLTKERIFVTEIMPGLTDTGHYDEDSELKDRIERARDFGYEWNEETMPIMSAKRVGEAVSFVMNAEAHIREISLIPYGQYPHLGS